jgi:hypothetical protein
MTLWLVESPWITMRGGPQLVYLQQRVALLPDEGRRTVGGGYEIVRVDLDLTLGDRGVRCDAWSHFAIRGDSHRCEAAGVCWRVVCEFEIMSGAVLTRGPCARRRWGVLRLRLVGRDEELPLTCIGR